MGADKVIGLRVETDGEQSVKTVGSIKTQIREATQDLITMREKFGDTSAEAANAAKKVAILRDEMGDAKALADAFNPDRKFNAFSQALQGVTGGFAALQGAQALFGAESEEVQKTLLKVQAALALSQGLNSILEAKDAFKNLNLIIQQSAAFQKINAAATALAATVMRAFGASTVATGTAFKVLRTAIITTGIGALIVGVGLLVDKIMTWTDETKAAADAQEKLKKITDDLNASLDVELGALDRSGEVLKLQAKLRGQSASDIAKIDESTARLRTQALERQKQELIKSGADTSDIEKKIQEERQRQEVANLNSQIAFKEKNDADTKQREQKADQLSKQQAEKHKAELKAFNERELQAQDELAKIQFENNQRAIGELEDTERTKINIDHHNKQVEIEELKVSEETKTALLAANARSRSLALRELDDKLAQEEAKAREETLDKLAQSGAGHTMNATGSLTPEQQKERATLLFDLLHSETDIKMQALNDEYSQRFELIKGNEDAELNLKKWYSGEKMSIDQAETDARLALYSAIGQGIGALGGLFEQGTAAAKISALAEIAIGTGVGFIQALDIAQKSAKGTGPLAAFAFPIFYATQIAAVLGAASKAKSALSSVKGGAGGGGGVSAPSITPVAPIRPTQSTTTLDQASINGIGNAAGNRAFVLDVDIANNRERSERLNRAARVG